MLEGLSCIDISLRGATVNGRSPIFAACRRLRQVNVIIRGALQSNGSLRGSRMKMEQDETTNLRMCNSLRLERVQRPIGDIYQSNGRPE